MAVGTMRYWASARAAAGVDEERVEAATLEAAIEMVIERHADNPQLAKVLGICAFVVDGSPAGRRPFESVELDDGWTAEALPPFAGG